MAKRPPLPDLGRETLDRLELLRDLAERARRPRDVQEWMRYTGDDIESATLLANLERQLGRRMTDRETLRSLIALYEPPRTIAPPRRPIPFNPANPEEALIRSVYRGLSGPYGTIPPIENLEQKWSPRMFQPIQLQPWFPPPRPPLKEAPNERYVG